ncbi:uncharacterized protein N7483_005343, partial [Penicillium malachiteum]|uniref:uncharacterized protein n=1 Tax=Penicillium malachiteum TaxID=1324776 RepID=UPI002549BDCF
MISENQALDILIIGAGVAGLSAAIAFGKQGHNVVILEKSGFLKETGAAIHLPPNCTAMLNWMGVDPTKFGGTLLHELRRYGFEGDLHYTKDFDKVRHMWQAEWYLVHRVDLHNYLKNRALETADLHTKCKITAIDINSSRPSVTLEDGRVFEADLLIGADGLHSQIRGAIAPEAPAPYPVGKACLRWLLPTEDLQKFDSTKDFVKSPGIFIEWAANDRRLVAYPCSDSKVYNLCAFAPSNEVNSDTQADGWQTAGDKQTVIKAFSEFSPGVRKIVEEADEKLKIWELFDMEGLPRWTAGHSALIGDSAHPFQPYMGQGGAMAIEDAVGVAALLPIGTKRGDIPARLRMYEANRRPRVEMVLKYTRLNGRDDDGSEGVRISPTEMVEVMGVCFSYNEVTQCQKLLAEQQQ